ncbi:extracellular solute-binding protein [Tropicimonas sp. IMCC34011]|uniref:extracellular solute-binding protein n=1 Tax=Tropicimonas sp. IMCC34011 TaxID=2248759 RepID=UPI000E2842EF|nr:extracellular solute-binding protein [Tropicimonas sp. IMCC34011]
MTPFRAQATALAAIWTMAGAAAADPTHGIAMYGDPALPEGFEALPYANPDAPKGGRFTFAEIGSYDSLNPFVLKGSPVYGQRVYGYESLMGRSYDEPFTLYGWLAESVETGPNREWVEFTIRPEARFSDGSPVTAEDVLWSFEILGTEGHPRYHSAWDKIASSEIVGERTVRFEFSEEDDELPLILGLRPILKKAQFEDVDFAAASNTIPVGSGPYTVGPYEQGRYMVLERDEDWWAADLPLMSGFHNFDEIRYEWFGDGDVAFETFRAGEISSNRETNMGRWQTAYDFPAVRSGDVVLSTIPHERPSGILGFVMNTRRAPFDDWRVREALINAFNFEFINSAINGGTEPRICSYFCNSVLAMEGGSATGRVAELLEPFADELLPGALEGYSLPVSDGSEANRAGTRTAIRLLGEAGYAIDGGVMTHEETGEALSFDIVLPQSAGQYATAAELYVEGLRRIGVDAEVVTVDSAQYKERSDAYDFDMTIYQRAVSLSPGNEQYLYWGADGVDEPGTYNWMGADNPAIEAMIGAMLTAESQEDFRAAVKALDRVLTTGRYVVPFWYSPESHLAHVKEIKYPETIAMYGDWLGFQPDVWWYEEAAE